MSYFTLQAQGIPFNSAGILLSANWLMFVVSSWQNFKQTVRIKHMDII